MTPKNGGRFDLKLVTSTPESAVYDAQLDTSVGTFRAQAQVGQRVDFGEWSNPEGAAPPAWLLADAHAALRAAFRSSRPEGRWPRRITRWRPEASD
ncbi:MAG TPA: hypothetical protein VEQ59_01070 [Polyangiaceae bacterium]|nr:hypothetical protein [Polyangiaceae bacterium]